ncbi:hypothetical protein I79_018393 [Cricetulus griseus]|uniref:Uncharacterized protein n=1 Tax=Cricetulus griseus TaxID=10029 RepID=G3I4L1_CRIGR|nr:hypothetical protein I79_018393 [Cricetulus griseus]
MIQDPESPLFHLQMYLAEQHHSCALFRQVHPPCLISDSFHPNLKAVLVPTPA